jgi:hypothetical protein
MYLRKRVNQRGTGQPPIAPVYSGGGLKDNAAYTPKMSTNTPITEFNAAPMR